MKLQKLSIKNFRGLRGDKNIIDFLNSNIIFLLGQNNVGKSSFLRAYEFFVNPKQEALITDFYDQDIHNEIEIEAEFLLEDEDDNDKNLLQKGETSEPGWIKNKWADLNGIVKIKKTWNKDSEGFKKYTWSPKGNDWIEGGFGGLHQNLTKYAPTPIAINAMETEDSLEEKVNKLINDDFLKTAKTDYEDDYKKAEEAVKELQKKVIGSDGIKLYNQNINKYFRKVFSNLELEIRPKNEEMKLIDTFKKNHSVNVKKDGCAREETFRQHGHGIIRQALFNFLAFLNNLGGESNKKEYIILFEEPELFLHPKIAYILRKSLYELSANSPYQVLCASHSPLMIDISKPKSSLVRVVRKSDDSTTTYQVGEELFQKDEEHKKMVQMINRFNSNVCEAFYADTVLLVEGDTETIVFRDLLERFFPEKEIYVLNTGSKNNIPFFQEVLSHFKIKYFVVHDTDTQDKASAWTLNQKIWGNIESDESARRYVFKDNFEEAHNYNKERKKSAGKPLAAYEFAQQIQSRDEEKDCMKFLKDMCSDHPSLNHDQNYIERIFQSS